MKEFIVMLDEMIAERSDKTVDKFIEILEDKYKFMEFEKFGDLIEDLIKFKMEEGETEERFWERFMKMREMCNKL